MDEKKGGVEWADMLLVLGIGLFVNCWFLGDGPLAGTEGHRALVGHQMAMGENWLLPKLYDQVYLTKPPLDYWILAGFEKGVGTTCGEDDAGIVKPPSKAQVCSREYRPRRKSGLFRCHLIVALYSAIENHYKIKHLQMNFDSENYCTIIEPPAARAICGRFAPVIRQRPWVPTCLPRKIHD